MLIFSVFINIATNYYAFECKTGYFFNNSLNKENESKEKLPTK